MANHGVTHARDRPYYPQTQGKIEHWPLWQCAEKCTTIIRQDTHPDELMCLLNQDAICPKGFDDVQTRRGRRRDVLSESRMREICMSGLMGGCGNGVIVKLLRHRQTKEAAKDRLYLRPPRHISALPEVRV